MSIPVSPLMMPLPREIHPVERVMNSQRNESKSAPMTLGQALAAKARLIAWYKLCARRTEPDVVELMSWHGAKMTVIDWARRLRPIAVLAMRIFVVSDAER